MSEIKIGDQAPDFELIETLESNWKLSDHLGGKTIVLLFFPLAYSPPCTEELCGIRDGFNEFQNLDAEVIAVSVDHPFVLDSWKKELELPFSLLSDFNTDVCRKFGACHTQLGPLKGVAKRSAFVIDNEGKIRYQWISDDPGVLPNIDEIRQVLDGLK
ncbi:MAG: redoxin domain-containing protein [Bacteroidales bacterium]|nr:redoxin domain-containing protein [Candidatus Latescibacterota bacterium]